MFTREETCHVATALNVMAMNFKAELQQPLLEDWLRRLSKYPAQRVLAVIDEIIEDYGFKTLPPYSEFKKRLEGTSTDKEAMQATKAEAEWSLLLDNIGLYGWNNEPDMHQTTERVIMSMGGWQAVCAWPEAYLGLKHKEFIERWQLYDAQGDLMQGGAAALEAAHEERLAINGGNPAQKPTALPQGTASTASNPAQARRLPRGFLRHMDDACRPEEATEQAAKSAHVPSYKGGRQDPLASLSEEERRNLAKAVGEIA